MSMNSEPSVKERIAQVATRLFARKGYSATGLREIVKEAGASVAMVNYHFGSKEALLQSLMDIFFTKMHSIAVDTLGGDGPPELRVRRHFRAAIAFFRQNPELVRLAITELPHDLPGIVEFKADRVMKIVSVFANTFLPLLPETIRAHIRPEIYGPAVMGALSSHFLLRPVLESVFSMSFDDAFYENFADELADLVMYGALRAGAVELSDRKD
jgi:AcrR family transcriptional regulator